MELIYLTIGRGRREVLYDQTTEIPGYLRQGCSEYVQQALTFIAVVLLYLAPWSNGSYLIQVQGYNQINGFAVLRCKDGPFSVDI